MCALVVQGVAQSCRGSLLASFLGRCGVRKVEDEGALRCLVKPMSGVGYGRLTLEIGDELEDVRDAGALDGR
jgi:hypothetical protein